MAIVTGTELLEYRLSHFLAGIHELTEEQMQTSTPANHLPTINSWMLRGLRGGMRHGCSGCSIGRTMSGFLPPVMAHLAKIYRDEISFSRSIEGLIFMTGEMQEVLKVTGLSFYCQSGTSHDMRVYLSVRIYSADGKVDTEHVWDEKILKKGFMDRNKPAKLNGDASRIIHDAFYHPLAREILQQMIEQVALGPKKLFDLAKRNALQHQVLAKIEMHGGDIRAK